MNHVSHDSTVDVLAFGAHPDDVELCVGGTLRLARARGLTTAICHLTAGEMGSRGTAETRREEAQAAAAILDVQAMEILGLPDGRLTPDLETKEIIVRVLRKYRPTTVLAPPIDDLHPDHQAAGRAIREAWFLAGLKKWEPQGDQPWRPPALLHYMQHTPFEPTFVVDVSEHFEDKRCAAACYDSQFHVEGRDGPATFIARPDFWSWWEGRHAWWGHFIGVPYGEPFRVEGPLPMKNPFDLFAGFGKYRNDDDARGASDVDDMNDAVGPDLRETS